MTDEYYKLTKDSKSEDKEPPKPKSDDEQKDKSVSDDKAGESIDSAVKLTDAEKKGLSKTATTDNNVAAKDSTL